MPLADNLKRREYLRKYNARPEVKARKLAWMREKRKDVEFRRAESLKISKWLKSSKGRKYRASDTYLNSRKRSLAKYSRSEKRRACSRRYYLRNKAKCRASAKAYHIANYDRMVAWRKKYDARNRHHKNELERRRRALCAERFRIRDRRIYWGELFDLNEAFRIFRKEMKRAQLKERL